MSKLKKHDTIEKIEKGNYKGKAILYMLRGLDLLQSVIDYAASFCIPFITVSATKGNVDMAMLGLGFLLTKDMGMSALSVVNQQLSVKFKLAREDYVKTKAYDLLEKSRGLVTEKIEREEGKEQIRTVGQAEIFAKIRNHFGNFVRNQNKFLRDWTNVIGAGVAFTGAMMTASFTNNNMVLAPTLLGAGLITSIATTAFSNKKRMNIYPTIRKLRNQEEVSENELVNREPINEKDTEYIQQTVKNAGLEHTKLDEKLGKMFTNVRFINMAVLSGIVGTLAVSDMMSGAGLTGPGIIGAIPMIAFYNGIAFKMNRAIRSVQDIIERRQDYVRSLEEVNEIAVQIEEKDNIFKTTDRQFESLQIQNFKGNFYLPQKLKDQTIYEECTLQIPNMEMKKGEMTLLTGESGSGKSTIFELIRDGDINNKRAICIDGTEKVDRLDKKSVIYYNPRMKLNELDNPIRQITLGKDEEDLTEGEKGRLRKILVGLGLEDVCKNPLLKGNLIELIENRNSNQFSDGQQQRLVLAKMLYLLDSSKQMIILDEPTARLDPATTGKVLSFIKSFCNEDEKRILLIASHQSEIAAPLADKQYNIGENGIVEKVQTRNQEVKPPKRIVEETRKNKEKEFIPINRTRKEEAMEL